MPIRFRLHDASGKDGSVRKAMSENTPDEIAGHGCDGPEVERRTEWFVEVGGAARADLFLIPLHTGILPFRGFIVDMPVGITDN